MEGSGSPTAVVPLKQKLSRFLLEVSANLESAVRSGALVQVWMPELCADGTVVLGCQGLPYTVCGIGDLLALFRCVSVRYRFSTDVMKPALMGAIGRVFTTLEPEMSHNVQKYDKQVYLRVSEAQRCRVHSTMMVPIFGSDARDQPLAVFELVQGDRDVIFPSVLSQITSSLKGLGLYTVDLETAAVAAGLRTWPLHVTSPKETVSGGDGGVSRSIRARQAPADEGGPASSSSGALLPMDMHHTSTSGRDYIKEQQHQQSMQQTQQMLQPKQEQQMAQQVPEPLGPIGMGATSSALAGQAGLGSLAIALGGVGSTSGVKRLAEGPAGGAALASSQPTMPPPALTIAAAAAAGVGAVPPGTQPFAPLASLQQQQQQLDQAAAASLVAAPIPAPVASAAPTAAVATGAGSPPGGAPVAKVPSAVALAAANGSGDGDDADGDGDDDLLSSDDDDDDDSDDDGGGGRRRGGKSGNNRVGGGAGKRLRFEDLQAQFGLGLKEAATNLGICATTLKRACRRHGIKRWPRRQIAKLSKALTQMQAAQAGTAATGGVAAAPAGMVVTPATVAAIIKQQQLHAPKPNTDAAGKAAATAAVVTAAAAAPTVASQQSVEAATAMAVQQAIANALATAQQAAAQQQFAAAANMLAQFVTSNMQHLNPAQCTAVQQQHQLYLTAAAAQQQQQQQQQFGAMQNGMMPAFGMMQGAQQMAVPGMTGTFMPSQVPNDQAMNMWRLQQQQQQQQQVGMVMQQQQQQVGMQPMQGMMQQVHAQPQLHSVLQAVAAGGASQPGMDIMQQQQQLTIAANMLLQQQQQQQQQQQVGGGSANAMQHTPPGSLHNSVHGGSSALAMLQQAQAQQQQQQQQQMAVQHQQQQQPLQQGVPGFVQMPQQMPHQSLQQQPQHQQLTQQVQLPTANGQHGALSAANAQFAVASGQLLAGLSTPGDDFFNDFPSLDAALSTGDGRGRGAGVSGLQLPAASTGCADSFLDMLGDTASMANFVGDELGCVPGQEATSGPSGSK